MGAMVIKIAIRDSSRRLELVVGSQILVKEVEW
jgi:hypothetical protein